MNKPKFTTVKNGTVTTPSGFLACGLHAGLKPDKKKKDFALIASSRPASAAGTFTTNQVKAAPVQLSMRHIAKGNAVAIVANSGNANACTGLQGVADAKEMAALTARALGCKAQQVLVCSTGRIGVNLPMDIIRDAIPDAVSKLDGGAGHDAATAIMTSDSRQKEIAVRLQIDNKTVTIGGCAKGAGMIDPMMATMLAFITTDAAVDPKTLKRCLSAAVDQSFNSICVDGDMSTNDTVLMLANGAAGTSVLRSYHKDLDKFQDALNFVTRELARMIVSDGEGVTKFVEVHVEGAASANDARIAAESISKSTLAKCAWFGGDPNWGRIMCALGYSAARVREELVDIYYDGLLVVRHGKQAPCPTAKLRKIVAKPMFRITVNLHLGQGKHTVYTTDLTDEYVNFNKGE